MDLQSIIENGSASVTVQITAKDLKEFADHLMNIALRQAQEAQAAADGESFFSKAEVLALFGICPTTLWLWAKNNYLKPVKAGRKVLYRKSDVQRFLKSREESNEPSTGEQIADFIISIIPTERSRHYEDDKIMNQAKRGHHR